ncbi:MAG: type IV secretion system DNA-binding domain-containing protein [Gordonia sp. (in: high G+C Gram-positive bacteria)]
MTGEVEVRALRPLEDAEAARLRLAMPLTLAGLIAPIPGATLRSRLTADGSGELRMSVAVACIDAYRLRLDSELRSVIEDFGVVEDTEDTAPEGYYWPLVPATDSSAGRSDGRGEESSDSVGVVVDGTSSRSQGAPAAEPYWSALASTPASSDDTDDLLTLLSRVPDVTYDVSVEISSEARPREPRWSVIAGFWTADDTLPLRLRAFVARCLPGFRIGAPGERPHPLTVPNPVLPHLLRIPVAGSRPLPGILTGPPPALPVVRRALGQYDDASGTAVRLGKGELPSGAPTDLSLVAHERRRHVHIVGRTGTGKSSLLAAIAHSVASSGDGGLILDPHGHLVNRIISELPESAVDRTWVIRAGDPGRAVPINPLAVDDPVRRDIVIQDYADMFRELFDPAQIGIAGPYFEERLTMALRGLIALRGKRATILDAPLIQTDEGLAKQVLEKVDDARVRAWWKNDLATRSRSSDYGEMVSWFSSKFSRFDTTAAMKAAMGTGADAFDPAQAMDEGRLILVDLSKGKLGEVASRLLGYLYISRFWSAALQRSTTRPFTVMVDEVQSFSFGALPDMLSEGRKFGLSVIVCHQYLGQLERQLDDAIEGNTATTIAFRTSAPDAVELSARFGGQVGVATLTTLPDLTAVCQRVAGDVAPVPHTLTVDHNFRGLGRSGAELEEVVARIDQRSYRDLVEPHLGLRTLGEELGAPALAPRASGKIAGIDGYLAEL